MTLHRVTPCAAMCVAISESSTYYFTNDIHSEAHRRLTGDDTPVFLVFPRPDEKCSALHDSTADTGAEYTQQFAPPL